MKAALPRSLSTYMCDKEFHRISPAAKPLYTFKMHMHVQVNAHLISKPPL